MKRIQVKRIPWHVVLFSAIVISVLIGLQSNSVPIETFFLVTIVILFPFAILELTPWRREVRRRVNRNRRGQFVQCGYDLRGNEHERCPECGEEIRKADPA